MTLINDVDLDTPNMYHHTKNDRSGSRHSKFRSQTGHTNAFFAPTTLTLTCDKRTWPNLSKDVRANQKRTFYVKAFESGEFLQIDARDR